MISYYDKKYEVTLWTIQVDANGDISVGASFIFKEPFVNAPAVLVVPPLLANGTWTAGSITTTGFTLSIATATYLDADTNYDIVVMAHEKM